jgi:hypothetical protein
MLPYSFAYMAYTNPVPNLALAVCDYRSTLLRSAYTHSLVHSCHQPNRTQELTTNRLLVVAYVIYRLIRHRRDFSRVIVGTHSALSTTRFLRLAGLCISYLLVGLPITLYTTYTNLMQGGFYFDYSWKYLHSGVSSQNGRASERASSQGLIKWCALACHQWEYVPMIEQQATFSLGSWAYVIAGILFLAAFGFGEEALSVYGQLARLLGWRSRSAHSPTTSHQSEVAQISFKPIK